MTRVTLFVLLFPLIASTAGLHDEILFEKHAIDLGAAETCEVADLNRDGKLDIVSGENWFEGPEWKRHSFRELFYANDYLDAFSDYAFDMDGDGDADVTTVSWFSKEIAWYENPGNGDGLWKKRLVFSGSPVEFAFLADLDNDGKARELLPQFGNAEEPLSWFSVEDGRFERHIVSQLSYGHGIGAGDVNGDGRTDILTPKGWWEAPRDPKSGEWIHHDDFGQFDFPHLGFLFVEDVDGKGRPDIITSYAHGYGVLWLEQTADGVWKKHMIDESWSQPHAVTLVDLNGDGRRDIVTGKRYHAHNGKDPGGNEPLGVYWYESRVRDGELYWKRHVIDYGTRTGGGMQLPVVDIDGDTDLDILAPGKGGLFLFENKSR